MPDVRPAEPRDDAAVAKLLYESASGRYDLFGGGRRRALRLLERSIATPGNDTSRDGVLVAEIDGRVAGAIAVFPWSEMGRRRWRWVLLALRRRAPWRWVQMLLLTLAGSRIPYEPPADSLYVDGLATDAGYRRRGVASALLEAADEHARALGLRSVSLDTAATNSGAQALYEGAGFSVAHRLDPQGPIPAIVFYVRELA